MPSISSITWHCQIDTETKNNSQSTRNTRLQHARSWQCLSLDESRWTNICRNTESSPYALVHNAVQDIESTIQKTKPQLQLTSGLLKFLIEFFSPVRTGSCPYSSIHFDLDRVKMKTYVFFVISGWRLTITAMQWQSVWRKVWKMQYKIMFSAGKSTMYVSSDDSGRRQDRQCVTHHPKNWCNSTIKISSLYSSYFTKVDECFRHCQQQQMTHYSG